MTKTITTLPLEIKQFFDRNLLSQPVPKFNDDSERLWKFYLVILHKYKKKCLKDPKRLAKFEELEKEFLELYERTKAKEKDIKGKTEYETQGPFYSFVDFDKFRSKIYLRLRRQTSKIEYEQYRTI